MHAVPFSLECLRLLVFCWHGQDDVSHGRGDEICFIIGVIGLQVKIGDSKTGSISFQIFSLCKTAKTCIFRINILRTHSLIEFLRFFKLTALGKFFEIRFDITVSKIGIRRNIENAFSSADLFRIIGIMYCFGHTGH